MANDITIVVEASLGDTLLKLELAKLAVEDLGTASSSVGADIGDESNRSSFASRLGNLERHLGNLGDRGPLGSVIRAFGNLAAAMISPIAQGAQFAQEFDQLGVVAQGAIGAIATLGISFVGLAVTIAAGVVVVEALASALGILIAIVADLVAPLTAVVTLLGLLGVGFVIAAKRAADGGGKLNEFSKELATLQSMFAKTANILAHVFLPYLVELAGAAEKALLFLDRIIKLPLGQAFRAIDTRGTKLLGEFVDRVSQVLSKPIRLALHVAFEDTAFANMVADWWHRFVGFLFGTTERHPVELRPGVFKIEKKTVDGVLQPFIDWWNRQHFTKQGIKMGNQIVLGMVKSGIFGDMAKLMFQVFTNAFKQAFKALLTLNQRMNDALDRWGAGVVKMIAGHFSDLWNKIKSIWDQVVSFLENPISINIDWPSPPSWLSNLPGSGIIKSITGNIPGIGSVAGIGSARPMAAMAGAPNVTIHVHGADLSDAPTRRRIAGQLGKEIAQDWRRRAGGH